MQARNSGACFYRAGRTSDWHAYVHCPNYGQNILVCAAVLDKPMFVLGSHAKACRTCRRLKSCDDKTWRAQLRAKHDA